MQPATILILGGHDGSNPIHERTRDHVLAAAKAHATVANTRWMTAQDVALYPGMVTEAHGVLLAPGDLGQDIRADESLLHALTLIRKHDLPLLATGASALLIAVELAREVLGMGAAGIALRGASVTDPVVLSTQASEGGFPLRLEAEGRALYGDADAAVDESGQPAFIINPDYAASLQEAGLDVIGRTEDLNLPRLHRLRGQRWHVSASFLPQAQTQTPHPLFHAFLGAANASRNA